MLFKVFPSIHPLSIKTNTVCDNLQHNQREYLQRSRLFVVNGNFGITSKGFMWHQCFLWLAYKSCIKIYIQLIKVLKYYHLTQSKSIKSLNSFVSKGLEMADGRDERTCTIADGTYTESKSLQSELSDFCSSFSLQTLSRVLLERHRK